MYQKKEGVFPNKLEKIRNKYFTNKYNQKRKSFESENNYKLIEKSSTSLHSNNAKSN